MIFIIILCVVNILLASSAIISNALVFIAIVSTPLLHNPSNILLCSLAIADFSVGLIVQPIFVFYLVGYRDVLKTSFALTALFFVGVSITTMTYMAVDRCLALRLHLRYHSIVTNKRTLIFLALIWITAGLSLVQFEFGPNRVSVALIAALAIADFATAIICYVSILRIVRRHNRQIVSQMQAFNVPTVNQGRSLVTMFYIHAIFVLCGLPFVVTLLYISLTNLGKPEAIFSSSAIFCTTTLVLLNSSINPCVYYRRMSGIRNAVNHILGRMVLSCEK